MKNGRTASNYVEPPDDSRMEGYKTDCTDAGSMCCTGRQNDDLKNRYTELSDIESPESWRYPEVENCAEDSILWIVLMVVAGVFAGSFWYVKREMDKDDNKGR